MHCMKCGAQLPPDAKFCYKCGTPVGNIGDNPTKEQWEYCEIQQKRNYHWFFSNKSQVQLYAEAVSPKNGRYTAVESSRTKYIDSSIDIKKIEPLLDEITLKLVQSGWEPLSERGEAWYSLRFRRSI